MEMEMEMEQEQILGSVPSRAAPLPADASKPQQHDGTAAIV